MTSEFFSNIALVLADSRLNQFGSRFRGRGADLTSEDYLLLAGIAIVVPLGIWLLSRLSKQKSARSNSPKELFNSLCAAHKLPRGDRKLLRQLASWQRLTQPAKLFLEPNRFFVANLGPDLQSQKAKFLKLRERIFGDLDSHVE